MKKSLSKLQKEKQSLREEITELFLPDQPITLSIAERAKNAKEKSLKLLQVEQEILSLITTKK